MMFSALPRPGGAEFLFVFIEPLSRRRKQKCGNSLDFLLRGKYNMSGIVYSGRGVPGRVSLITGVRAGERVFAPCCVF